MKINDGKVTCILVSGDAGVGKDTVSDLLAVFLSQSGLSVTRESFALSLKLIARRFMGWNGIKDEKGRDLLQGLGELGRQYDEDMWCKAVKDRASECVFQDQVLIISDWRYYSEREFFEKHFLMYDVITVRVGGDRIADLNVSQISHSSEVDIGRNMKLNDFDILIGNYGELEILQDVIMSIVSEMVE